jgi:hypothetical protein
MVTHIGDMRHYRNLGNNDAFVLLLDLMRHQAQLRQQLGAGQLNAEKKCLIVW